LHEGKKPEEFDSIVAGNFTSEYVAENGNKSVANKIKLIVLRGASIPFRIGTSTYKQHTSFQIHELE
jgi:hypothetical protein